MNRGCKYAVLGPVVIYLCCWGCVFPSGQHGMIDQPPYERIEDGLQPVLHHESPEVPLLKPGEKVAFFAQANGKIKTAFCTDLATAVARLPRTEAVVARSSGESRVDIQTAETVLLRVGDKGELPMAVSTSHLLSQRGLGEMQIAAAHESAQTLRHEGSLATTTARLATAAEHGHGSHLTAAQTQSAQQTAGAGGTVTEQFASRTKPPTENTSTRQIEHAMASLHAKERTGKFNSLTGESPIDPLAGNYSMAGFYGSSDILIIDESLLLVPSNEREELLRILRQGGPLASLINRDISAHYRTQTKLTNQPEYACAMNVTFHPEHFYHGQKLCLQITVKNTGNAPLFDMLVLNELPANTDFASFTVDPGSTRGFLPGFIQVAGRNLIFLKLYRPLAPGDSFRLPVILKAKPWVLP